MLQQLRNGHVYRSKNDMRKVKKQVPKEYDNSDVKPCTGCGKEPLMTCDKCNEWRCEDCMDIHLGGKISECYFVCKPACHKEEDQTT